jgi:uncharacterized protein with PIN domain
MDRWASFRFFGSLNDFLPLVKKEVAIPYPFTGVPAVKDAIEAIGIPHPEIAGILINQQPAQPTTPLHPGDQVKVYPFNGDYPGYPGYALRPEPPLPVRFILDVHLGKLAKALRILGFDACYQNDYDDKTIASLAAREKRLVLTRDIGLLKHKAITWGYWLRSQHPEKQITEVLQHFRLQDQAAPFTRCLACNAPIEAVPKEMVWEQLPPNTRLYFEEFFRCIQCRRVYWKGSHYQRMQAFVNLLPTRCPPPDAEQGRLMPGATPSVGPGQ